MFGPDFYPTDEPNYQKLIDGLIITGKVILEPEAGKGDNVERLQRDGAAQVIACEINKDLQKILQTKCVVIADDFLKVTSDQVSHVDFIIMNPPFSAAAQHINHAWEIAPPGCKIRSLCNTETLKNAYSKSREQLIEIVNMYGQTEDLGDSFTQAERKTGVNVSVIRLQKPGENSNEFEGFFMEDEPEEAGSYGLMSYNLVRDLVNRYVKACKIFDEQLETAVRLSEMTAGFYGGKLGFQVTRNNEPLERNEFRKGMQKSGWKWIFRKLNLEKHSTKGLREDINKFVEKQKDIPFTMKNIYRMLEIVIGTTGQRMDKAILEVFERITAHHHENRQGLPGWKTNSHYLLTKRFIAPGIITRGYDGPEVTHYSERYELIDDLVKSLCYISGDNYDDHGGIWSGIRNGKVITKCKEWDPSEGKEIEKDIKTPIEWGKWFEWSFFKIRVYKKGTVHFEFKNETTWALFNQRVAKLKGYPLPEKKEETAYQAQQNGHKQQPKPKQTTTARKPVILSTIKIQ